MAAMDEYNELFSREYRFLANEYKRLQQLLKEVAWYNFETAARGWKHPWPESFGGSSIELHGQRYALVNSRGGRKCETATFPVYFAGSIDDAPPLPPTIILNELKTVYDDLRAAEKSCSDPYEYAPGGREYEKMIRESDGVRLYNTLSSKPLQDSDGRERATCENGPGLLLGDPMERQTAESTETTTSNILGRVRGDRCLVCQ